MYVDWMVCVRVHESKNILPSTTRINFLFVLYCWWGYIYLVFKVLYNQWQAQSRAPQDRTGAGGDTHIYMAGGDTHIYINLGLFKS